MSSVPRSNSLTVFGLIILIIGLPILTLGLLGVNLSTVAASGLRLNSVSAATISVSPQPVNVGTNFQVFGSGWQPNSIVQITITRADGVTWAGQNAFVVSTDSSGTFGQSGNIQQYATYDQTCGSICPLIIKGTDGFGDSASFSFDIEQPVTVTSGTTAYNPPMTLIVQVMNGVTNAPLAGATVTVSVQGHSISPSSVTTNSNGYADFSPVYRGDYATINAAPPSYLATTLPATQLTTQIPSNLPTTQTVVWQGIALDAQGGSASTYTTAVVEVGQCNDPSNLLISGQVTLLKADNPNAGAQFSQSIQVSSQYGYAAVFSNVPTGTYTISYNGWTVGLNQIVEANPATFDFPYCPTVDVFPTTTTSGNYATSTTIIVTDCLGINDVSTGTVTLIPSSSNSGITSQSESIIQQADGSSYAYFPTLPTGTYTVQYDGYNIGTITLSSLSSNVKSFPFCNSGSTTSASSSISGYTTGYGPQTVTVTPSSAPLYSFVNIAGSGWAAGQVNIQFVIASTGKPWIGGIYSTSVGSSGSFLFSQTLGTTNNCIVVNGACAVEVDISSAVIPSESASAVFDITGLGTTTVTSTSCFLGVFDCTTITTTGSITASSTSQILYTTTSNGVISTGTTTGAYVTTSNGVVSTVICYPNAGWNSYCGSTSATATTGSYVTTSNGVVSTVVCYPNPGWNSYCGTTSTLSTGTITSTTCSFFGLLCSTTTSTATNNVVPFAVHVAACNGQPAIGATVILGSAILTTDSGGNALFSNAPIGSQQIQVLYNGGSFNQGVIVIANGSASVSACSTGLAGGFTVHVSACNSPAVGAQVTLGGATELTDSNGVATFDNLQSGSATILVSYNGQGMSQGAYITNGGSTSVSLPCQTTTSIPPPQPNPFSIELVSGCSGQPISGATISLGGQTLLTDSNGQVIFNGLQSGEYTASIGASGYSTSATSTVSSTTSVGSSGSYSIGVYVPSNGGGTVIPMQCTTVTSYTTISTTVYSPVITVQPTQFSAKPGSIQTFTITGIGFPQVAGYPVTVYFNGPTIFSFSGQTNPDGSINIVGQGVVLSGTYDVYAVATSNALQQSTYTYQGGTSTGEFTNTVVNTVLLQSAFPTFMSNHILVSVNTNAGGLPLAHITITPSQTVPQTGQLSVTGYGFSPNNNVLLVISNPYFQHSTSETTDAQGDFTDTISMTAFNPNTYNLYVVDQQTGFQVGPYQLIVTGGTSPPTFTVNVPTGCQYSTGCPTVGQYRTGIVTSVYTNNGVVATQTLTTVGTSNGINGALQSLSPTIIAEDVVGGILSLFGAAIAFFFRRPVPIA